MEDMMGALAELLVEGLLVVEMPGASGIASTVVTCCNSQARRLLGLPADVAGRPLDFEGVWADGGRVSAAVASVVGSQRVVRLTLAPVSALAASVVDARVGGLPSGAAIVLSETPLADAERAAAEFERKMACAARVCGRVGHDLNNLMTGVLGYAELAQDYLEEGSQAHDHLAQVMESVDRATAFNADLLAMASREVVSPTKIDLTPYLVGLVPEIARAAGDHVEVRIVVPDHPLRVFVDADRLARVLSMLVSNAGQATAGRATVRVSAERRSVRQRSFDGTARLEPGDYAMMAVTDSGVGFQPGVLPHLFEPFFTTRVGVKSAGLGLGIVYGTVRQAGGVVAAHGEPGAGATFRVYLPEIDSDEAAAG